MTIHQDQAIICVHVGCEIIFSGPSTICPACGWQGVGFRELETAFNDSCVYALTKPEPPMQTKMIQ
jgi:hypothetical protein